MGISGRPPPESPPITGLPEFAYVPVAVKFADRLGFPEFTRFTLLWIPPSDPAITGLPDTEIV
jgi:hypothetical protein